MTEEQITFVKNSWKMFRKVDAGLIGDVFIQNYFRKTQSCGKCFLCLCSNSPGK